MLARRLPKNPQLLRRIDKQPSLRSIEPRTEDIKKTEKNLTQSTQRTQRKDMYHAEDAENTEKNIITLRDLCEL